MQLTNSQHTYGVVTRVLHWLVALLMIGLIVLGWWMVGLGYYDRWYHDALESHKALGMIVLALGSAKVVWYLVNARVAFLLLMVVIPVSGYLISTSAGDGISVFGLVEVPALVSKDDRVRDLAIAVHYYAAYTAAALVCLHAGAALKHQLVDRDGTLRRMLW